MSNKKRVIENSILYTFSSMLVKAMGFLLLPIYTIYLSPTDYGITGLVNGFINVANFIVAMSLYTAIIRFYNEFKEDHSSLKRFYGTVVIFVLIAGLISIAAGYVFQNLVVSMIFDGIDYYPIVFLAFINLVVITLNRIHQNMLQAMQKGRKLTLINMLVFVSTAIVNLVLIIGFDFGALGMVLSQTIVFSIYSVYMILDLVRQDLIAFTFDIKILKKALRYSIPLLPHNLSTHIAGLVSRIFINSTSTLANVGLYNIGMQFAALIDIVQVAVNKAFQPWLFNELKSGDMNKKEDIIVLSDVLLQFYSFIYMVIGLFSQEVVIIMTDKAYTLSWTVIPILVMAFSVKSVYYFYVNLIMYNIKASRRLFIATLIGSLANIISSYFLVKPLGMYGAALSFLLAKILVVGIVVKLASEYNIIGYRLSQMVKRILPSQIAMWIGLYFSYTRFMEQVNLWNLLYKIMIFIVYTVFIIYVNRAIIKKYDMINKVGTFISSKMGKGNR